MIYVHVPFCRSFCTYCDFYSEVAHSCSADEGRKFEAYSSALSYEIKQRSAQLTGDVNTLYIGGGTPSVLPLSVFESLLSTLSEVGHSRDFVEFTVEVNPEDILEKGEGYVEGLLNLGVNRISMGVQSFDDSILKWMNRRHDSATARKAYAILENAGVPNISIDLIFGLPQLSDSKWEETISKALDISARGCLPQHISSYQLSVEPGSALAQQVARNEWEEASEELCARQYDTLCTCLGKSGYHHYEISNFAQTGYEAVHNRAYWKHVPYVGLGPGAHSLRCSDAGFRRQWNIQDLGAYISAAQNSNLQSVVEYEDLTKEDITIERIMLGLRTSDGLPEHYLQASCKETVLGKALSQGDLVRVGDGNLRIPESRFFVSDTIISNLI